jgi:outer membrane protein assembly factor BamB
MVTCMRLAQGFVLLTALACQRGFAEDWPHWMGANRDNQWNATGIIDKFPSNGPAIVWQAKVAGGYSGPAVVGDRVFVTDYATSSDAKIANFERKESTGTETVRCLSAKDGQELWIHSYPVTYSISYPAGPRCTPVVDGDRVISLGAEGNLICLDVASGKVQWSHDLKSAYSTKTALWGYASHPLIDGNKLICVVGGKGTHTVAFDKRTGKEIWRYGTASEQGYSPCLIIEASGKRQLVITSPDWVAAVDPESGSEYWSTKYTATNGSIIMTPIRMGKYLFIGGYSNQSLMLELDLDKPGVEVVWQNESKTGVSPVNVQPFLDGDIMYGMHESGALMAVQIPQGKRLWETGQPIGSRPLPSASAFIVKNQDRYFLFAETGELVIARLTPEGYAEVDRAKVIEPTNNAFGRRVVWCAPAFANGRMYVRNDESCICVELTKR